MASSSKDAGYSGFREVPIEELSEQSDHDTTSSSESEDEDVVASPRDRDSDPRDDFDKDPDADADGSASQTTTKTDFLMKLDEIEDVEALELLYNEQMKKAKSIVEDYNLVRAKLKSIKKQKAKEERDAKKAQKFLEKRMAKKKESETNLTLNIKNTSGETFSISITPNKTMKELKLLIAESIKVPKSHVKTMNLRFKENPITKDEHRKTIGGFGLKDGDLLNLGTFGVGGGTSKVIKKAILKKKAGTLVSDNDKSTFQVAFDIAKKLSEKSDFSLDEMMKTMSPSELASLKKYLDHDKARLEDKCYKIAEFSSDYKAISVLLNKLEVVADHYKEQMFNSVLDKYEMGGSIKKTEITKDVEIATKMRERDEMEL
ncbi:unnamed protein product [Symbiodinium microadriaticum]|nr:unnamed protein product [Symbiodinium microadriaticum]CAE7873022.1 unnamed protein product [Symbiodinium sp. KB8]